MGMVDGNEPILGLKEYFIDLEKVSVGQCSYRHVQICMNKNLSLPWKMELSV